MKNIKNNMIEKSNTLNSLMSDTENMGLNELRFFCMYLSKLNSRHSESRTVEISVAEFEKLFDVKFNTTEFTKKIRKISGRTIKIIENSRIRILTLYSEFSWNIEKAKTLKITCNDMLMPYIFELKKNYTAYRLENISKLDSVQKIRFYEIMKQYEKLKTITIELKVLLNMMCCNISNFKDFNQKTLKSAIKDISEYTDITVTYEKVLKCRKCVAIKFFIESKSQKTDTIVEMNEQELKQIPVDEPKTLEGLYKKYFTSEHQENFRQNIKMMLQDIYKSEVMIKERTEVIYKKCVTTFKTNSQTTVIKSPSAYMQGIINKLIEKETENPKKEKRRSYNIHELEKFAVNYDELQKIENEEYSETHLEAVSERLKETKVICQEEVETSVVEPLSTVSDDVKKIFDETDEGIALFSKILGIMNDTTEYNSTVSILDIVDKNWRRFEGVCKNIITTKLREKENAPELIEVFGKI